MFSKSEVQQYYPALLPDDLRSQYLAYARIAKEKDAALWAYAKRALLIALPAYLLIVYFGFWIGPSPLLILLFVILPVSCFDIKLRQKDLEVQRRGLESVFMRRGLTIASDPGGRVEVYRA